MTGEIAEKIKEQGTEETLCIIENVTWRNLGKGSRSLVHSFMFFYTG
jgi:hypothetical protein